MRSVGTNYGGVFAGAAATIVAALIGWFTARTTARNQLAGTTMTARMAADEAERKRMDEQTAWIVSELRKEVDRLGAVVKQQAEQLQAQAERIDQLDSQNIQMRRVLEQHGLAVRRP